MAAAPPSESKENDKAGVIDPCTFSNLSEVITRHTHLALSVDFKKRVLSGTATLTLECLSNDVSSVILDTRDLSITSVKLIIGPSVKLDRQKVEEAVKFSYGEGNAKVPSYGRPLIIALPNAHKMSSTLSLTIAYSTSPSAEAIQWLTPAQTDGGKHPFLFTQCQAIGARTLLPCQDSPSAKAPYTAAITLSLADGPLTALMSALTDNSHRQWNEGVIDEAAQTKTFVFSQSVACCSYLMALVVGELARRDIDKRCAVYAAPSRIDAAEYEFANTGKMLDIAEGICGEYVWGRYDLLMLPASFPYGGMENPNLTFLTPTLVAGDRSLENVVAHEITHSWTGNLVTNVNWEHFWLNEGWTRLIESKIMGALRGEDHLTLDIANSQIILDAAVKRLGADHEFTKLNLSLRDTDPDDAFSSIPYEKGSEFLRYLEDIVGGHTVFAPFIKAYIAAFKHKTLDSADFQKFFCEYFEKEKNLSGIDWERWLRGKGMPPTMRKVESAMIKAAKGLLSEWVNVSEVKEAECVGKEGDVGDWCVDQITMFLDDLLLDFEEKMKEGGKVAMAVLKAKEERLKTVYGFAQSKNVEVLFRMNLIALCVDDEAQYESVFGMLGTIGRMKFVRPLYRALIKNADRRKVAEECFEKNKLFYHPICAKMVAQDLAQKK